MDGAALEAGALSLFLVPAAALDPLLCAVYLKLLYIYRQNDGNTLYRFAILFTT
jgi:hypothetical protein